MELVVVVVVVVVVQRSEVMVVGMVRRGMCLEVYASSGCESRIMGMGGRGEEEETDASTTMQSECRRDIGSTN
jgi:hypothetical protein